MKPLEIVHVTWVDSAALNEWSEITALDHEFVEIHTVGMLIHSDKDKYLVASSYDPENDSINAAMWIPAKCITSVRSLGVIPGQTKGPDLPRNSSVKVKRA